MGPERRGRWSERASRAPWLEDGGRDVYVSVDECELTADGVAKAEVTGGNAQHDLAVRLQRGVGRRACTTSDGDVETIGVDVEDGAAGVDVEPAWRGGPEERF